MQAELNPRWRTAVILKIENAISSQPFTLLQQNLAGKRSGPL